MFFLLQCGGIPFDGDTIKTRSLGGSESAAYYVAKGLAKLGHRVTIFTKCSQSGIFDGVRYEPMGRETPETPFGENFHFYATNTPHDVCIMQRHPKAFQYRWQSKINLWWLHDVALYRNKGDVIGQLWNIDKVLTVSEYHREQVAKVYGIDKSGIVSIRNGVDFDTARNEAYHPVVSEIHAKKQTVLTYSSRPERGLAEFLAILERLGDEYHGVICGYDNTTPQMADYYHSLWAKAEAMPNVTNLGALTKSELASLMWSSDLHVYPTAFEEVSCITAMECMAAGLPLITSAFAALPETCDRSGTELIPLKDGQPDVEEFILQIKRFFAPSSKRLRDESVKRQVEASQRFSWDQVVRNILSVVANQFADVSRSATAVGYIENSDIQALDEFRKIYGDGDCLITAARFGDIGWYYDWKDSEKDTAKHYSTRTEKLGRADVTQSPRYKHVLRTLQAKDGDFILIDWGCNAGHFTIPLAKAFPNCRFIGVDFDEKAVVFARDWAHEAEASNCQFYTPAEFDLTGLDYCDVLLLGEVLEHAGNLQKFWGALPKAARYIITTPYGPWESLSYKEKHPYREHLHHFERADLHELFGHFPEFRVLNIPHPTPSLDLHLGMYVTEFAGGKEIGRINYNRKFRETKPRQTVSACLLVWNSEETILKCLRSLEDVVDEVIVRYDETCNQETSDIVNSWVASRKVTPAVRFIEGKSPLEIGFDEARNESVRAASGDWILWIDTDEVLQVKDGWKGLLRSNPLDGYAIPQHHFSSEPPAVIKVDYPCRLFRNRIGIEFFGKVHEHPERELNKGVGPVQLTRLIEICHYGYKDEAVRRGRFDRNFRLLEQDREVYPERKLGVMLWLRDCGQRIQYMLERNGGQLTQEMRLIAKDGIQHFEYLLEHADLRMICDSLEFYSMCTEVLGAGIEAAMSIGVSRIPNGMPDSLPTYKGIFHSEEHIRKLADKLLSQGSDMELRYM